MHRKIDLLKKIYLFQDFTQDELLKLSKIATIRIVNPGDTIFYEKAEATALFVIDYGSIKILKKAQDGNEIVNTLGRGMHFGELPFLDGLGRSATAEALEKTELIEIPYKELNETLNGDSKMSTDFYISMSHFLAAKLRKVTTDLSFAREHNLKHF